jgi:predicted dinucleotide-binding enzyme
MASAIAGRALAGGNTVEIIGRGPANLATALDGKVIVDITNPITPDFAGFLSPEGSSGAQEIAKAAPAGAHVVKAFNTLPCDVLAAGSVGGRPVDVFIAGDDAQAKARVSEFIGSLGMRPMDAGALSMGGALENVSLLQLGLITHSINNTSLFLGASTLS